LVGSAIETPHQLFTRYCPVIESKASRLWDADAILRVLRSAPLQRLEDDQVLPCAACVMTMVGGLDDYRYFLLRIVGLALDNLPHLGAEPALIAGNTSRPFGRPVSESLLARGRSTNLARIPVSPKGCRY